MARRGGGEDPGLPIKLQPCSNGEFVPPPPTALVREAARRARAACEDNARRLGMSRRDFLRTTMGAATTLAVLGACSDERSARQGGEAGGAFRVPPEAATEPDAAADALGGEEFIFDVQGHLLEFDEGTPGETFAQAHEYQYACGEDDPLDCFSTETFLREVFERSDTSMAVLSAVPVGGLDDGPLRPEVMAAAIRQADRLCGDGRLYMQGQAYPSVGRIEDVLESMDAVKERYPITAWKVYTHAGGPGWRLDDDGDVPRVGNRFIEHAVELGVPIIAVHKGLSGGRPFASPEDVGPAARAHPEARFVVYHSGFEIPLREGPYEADGRAVGVDRLVRTLVDNGIGSGGNVYAELGSTWRTVMAEPTEAAHIVGKLLRYVGEDNVLWGTDSIWYGSPQDQIQAFRAFSISEELQERYGYPALTDARKVKILGVNAARLHGIDPVTDPCRPPTGEREEARAEAAGANVTYGPRTPAQVRAHMTAHGWD